MSLPGSFDSDFRGLQDEQISDYFNVSRELQNNSNADLKQQQSAAHNTSRNTALISVFTVIAIIVVTCFIVYLWHKLLKWFCKRDVADETSRNTAVVSQRVFHLTPQQRREVLAVIFSDTNKEVPKPPNVACGKQKRKPNSKERGVDILTEVVEVNTLQSTIPSDVEEGIFNHEPDTVASLPAAYTYRNGETSPGSIGQDAIELSVVDYAQDDIVIETTDPLLPESMTQPASAPSVGHGDDTNDAILKGTAAQPPVVSKVVAAHEQLPLPFRIRIGDEDNSDVYSSIAQQYPVELAVPTDPPSSSTNELAKQSLVKGEKEKGKLDSDCMIPMSLYRARLSEPIAFTPVSSVGSTFTSDLDDEGQDDDCPICLNSYHEGDILITSKHCSHVFHRDCIMGWLEKHDTCPVCRVDMVTQGEISQAATKIVGQTRMYVAVGSLARTSPQRHHQTPNSTVQRHVLPAHRRNMY